MGIFGKKDKTKTRTHKLVTGMIVGGAVASVLGVAAARKKRKDEEGDLIEKEVELMEEELEVMDGPEKMVVKEATKKGRGALRVCFGGLWWILKLVFRIFEAAGKKK